jgi:biopolymer transport protein ExbD
MRFKRRPLEAIPPYVAMADITFNLVLFFIIMAKTQDDSNIIWEPAKDSGTKLVSSNTKVSISVDRDNRVYLNGQQIGVREIADRVGRELGDKPQAERIVLLKIHKETLASTFNPIMEAVSQAGGEVVHIVDEESVK